MNKIHHFVDDNRILIFNKCVFELNHSDKILLITNFRKHYDFHECFSIKGIMKWFFFFVKFEFGKKKSWKKKLTEKEIILNG